MTPAHSCAEPPVVLNAGTDPRRPSDAVRLLSLRRNGTVNRGRVLHLPELFDAGDLLVLNDAATLPASLHGTVHGQSIELRLATAEGSETFARRWQAVLFGEGDWRQDTDLRPAPPFVEVGDRLRFTGLEATVAGVDATSPRLVTIELDRDGDALGRALYAAGQPVMYRHLLAPLRIADVQTPYASRPWAVEMPSTGRPLSWRVLHALRAKGVRLAFLTHAAGLSATGDTAIDARLPFDERFEIPEATTRAIEHTRRAKGRIIAAGTTVVRALEASGGRPGFGIARERISPSTGLELSDGILTGVHSPGESHWDLLGAFAAPEHLLRARTAAACAGFLAHELGDLMLIH